MSWNTLVRSAIDVENDRHGHYAGNGPYQRDDAESLCAATSRVRESLTAAALPGPMFQGYAVRIRWSRVRALPAPASNAYLGDVYVGEVFAKGNVTECG